MLAFNAPATDVVLDAPATDVVLDVPATDGAVPAAPEKSLLKAISPRFVLN
jgi:hypothetical protein